MFLIEHAFPYDDREFLQVYNDCCASVKSNGVTKTYVACVVCEGQGWEE